MPTAADIIDRVDRAVSNLFDGDADVTWLASVILDWRAGLPFEAALGLAPGWRAAWMLAKRDASIRCIAQRFPEERGRTLARKVAATIASYQASDWDRNRSAAIRPDGLAGDCHDVLAFGGAPGIEMLRVLLCR